MYAVTLSSIFIEGCYTMVRVPQPVANGLRTDHPVPDLPFIDDSHIPLDDSHAIQAVGRHDGSDMWGRQDRAREGRGWIAFTTDPIRHDLAWCVRYHPDHGRTVLLYRDRDASAVHAKWDAALLFRAGGYWWDGESWYRPSRVWDHASETYVRRPVPGATTITAADILTTGTGDPTKARVSKVQYVNVDDAPPERWLDDLTSWARSRSADRPLTGSVVRISAPELAGDQLLSLAEFADTVGVTASTLRSYLTRDQADIPLPQAVIGSRKLWSRPVAEEWAEQRRRSDEGLDEAVAVRRGDASQPAGITEVWTRFAQYFYATLWERPDRRRRWALRWRTPEAVQNLADELGWTVAAEMTGKEIVPWDNLAETIGHALVDEFAISKELDSPDRLFPTVSYTLGNGVSQTLEWLIRYSPTHARRAISFTIHETERRLEIPRTIIERSLRETVSPGGSLDSATLDDFFDRVLTPQPPGEKTPPLDAEEAEALLLQMIKDAEE